MTLNFFQAATLKKIWVDFSGCRLNWRVSGQYVTFCDQIYLWISKILVEVASGLSTLWHAKTMKFFGKMQHFYANPSRTEHHPAALLQPKSLFVSRVVSQFFWTKFEIWAGFGPIGSTENGPIFKLLLLLRAVFDAFISHFFKYCRTKKVSNVRKP